jgi:hypothetical protein
VANLHVMYKLASMSAEEYRRALAAAMDESQRLTAERQRIDGRLSELAEKIGTLSRLCGLAATVPWGLTDACRTVLRSAGGPMTAAELRDRLAVIGFDLSRYANALAALHTTLKRLAEAGEVAATAAGPRKMAYRWQRAPGAATRILQEARINAAVARSQRSRRVKR